MNITSMIILFLAAFSGLYTFAYWYDSSEDHSVIRDPEQRQRMRVRFKKQLPVTIALFAIYIFSWEYLSSF